MTLEIKTGSPRRKWKTEGVDYRFTFEDGLIVERTVCHQKAARANIARATARLFSCPLSITGIRLVDSRVPVPREPA